MEYTHVGHLGLVVSRLCLGTMNFGPHTPEPDSYSIMDSAVAYGINFFDTANVFGRHLGVGATVAATRSSWRRRCTGRWATGPTNRVCRSWASSDSARSPFGGCAPTGSI